MQRPDRKPNVPEPHLHRLRRVWGLCTTVPVLLVAATTLVGVDVPRVPALLPTALAVASGVAAYVAIVAVDHLFAASPPRTDEQARSELSRRQRLQLVIGQTPALLGCSLSLVLGGLAPVLAGAGCGIVATVRCRPSRRRLAGIEAVWRAAGSRTSMLRPTAGATEVP